MPNSEDIAQQQKLLAIYRRSLAIYLEQLAQQGQAFAMPSLLISITEAQDNIQRIKVRLRDQGVEIDDFLIDTKSPQAFFEHQPSITHKRSRRTLLIWVIVIVLSIFSALAVFSVNSYLLRQGDNSGVSYTSTANTDIPSTEVTIITQFASVIESTELYLSPNTDLVFMGHASIQTGKEVQLLQINQDWAKIRVRYGTTVAYGWVPLKTLRINVAPTLTPIPSSESVKLTFTNSNGQTVLIRVTGDTIEQMEFEVSDHSTITISLPPGNYDYHVSKLYVSPGAPPTPTPIPGPGLCAFYAGTITIKPGADTQIDILPLTNKGEPFFQGCSYSR